MSFPSHTNLTGTFDFGICFCLKILPSKVVVNDGAGIFRGESLFFGEVATTVFFYLFK